MSGQNVFVNYFGQLNMFGITGESQWNIVNGNPVMFPNGVADNIPINQILSGRQAEEQLFIELHFHNL